jgi:hypothetical protein
MADSSACTTVFRCACYYDRHMYLLSVLLSYTFQTLGTVRSPSEVTHVTGHDADGRATTRPRRDCHATKLNIITTSSIPTGKV